MIDVNFAVAGALTGFVIGLTGVGGGALMTPILLLFFGIHPATAVATDLWFAAITKIFGAKIHHAAGHIDWQIAKRLWLGSLPVAIIIVGFIAFGAEFTKIGWMSRAIGIVILITSLGLLFSPLLLAVARSHRLSEPSKFKSAQPAFTTAAGALLGLCVALTSIGAGALGSVILLYLYPLRMTPHRLVATDLVHAIPLAVVAGSGYLIAGLVDGWMLLSLLTGSIPAIALGSLLAKRISGRLIQICLALVLFAASLKTLL